MRDAHTADAGVNTRIDAFLDIVHNHRQGSGTGAGGRGKGKSVHGVHNQVPSPRGAQDFRAARVLYEHGGAVYVDSAGRRHAFTDPAVKLVIPPMGDMGSAALAAACRRVGIRAQALPRGDAREKLMILTPEAARDCRLGQYHVYTSQYMREGIDHLAGVVNVGDALTIPGTDVRGKRAAMKHAGRPWMLEGIEDDEKIPFLSIESDGNPYPPLLKARGSDASAAFILPFTHAIVERGGSGGYH